MGTWAKGAVGERFLTTARRIMSKIRKAKKVRTTRLKVIFFMPREPPRRSFSAACPVTRHTQVQPSQGEPDHLDAWKCVRAWVGGNLWLVRGREPGPKGSRCKTKPSSTRRHTCSSASRGQTANGPCRSWRKGRDSPRRQKLVQAQLLAARQPPPPPGFLWPRAFPESNKANM